jgi:hypothetical protein
MKWPMPFGHCQVDRDRRVGGRSSHVFVTNQSILDHCCYAWRRQPWDDRVHRARASIPVVTARSWCSTREPSQIVSSFSPIPSWQRPARQVSTPPYRRTPAQSAWRTGEATQTGLQCQFQLRSPIAELTDIKFDDSHGLPLRCNHGSAPRRCKPEVSYIAAQRRSGDFMRGCRVFEASSG